jgi:hypothetical protein
MNEGYEVHFDVGRRFKDLTIHLYAISERTDMDEAKDHAIELAEALALSPKITNVRVTGTHTVEIEIPAPEQQEVTT